jgi:predicted metal-dependent hydrolase
MPFVRRSPVDFSTVQFGTTLLEYRLRRTGRKKTVSIAVDPQAGIIVTAPAQAPKKRIDDLVRQKGPWKTVADRHPGAHCRTKETLGLHGCFNNSRAASRR